MHSAHTTLSRWREHSSLVSTSTRTLFSPPPVGSPVTRVSCSYESELQRPAVATATAVQLRGFPPVNHGFLFCRRARHTTANPADVYAAGALTQGLTGFTQGLTGATRRPELSFAQGLTQGSHRVHTGRDITTRARQSPTRPPAQVGGGSHEISCTLLGSTHSQAMTRKVCHHLWCGHRQDGVGPHWRDGCKEGDRFGCPPMATAR